MLDPLQCQSRAVGKKYYNDLLALSDLTSMTLDDCQELDHHPVGDDHHQRLQRSPEYHQLLPTGWRSVHGKLDPLQSQSRAVGQKDHSDQRR